MTQPPEDRRPEGPAGEGGPENEPTVAWTPPETPPEPPADEGGVGYAAIPDEGAPAAAEPPPAPPAAAEPPPAPPAANLPTEPPAAPPAPPPAEPEAPPPVQPSGPIISSTPDASQPTSGWQTDQPPATPATPATGWALPTPTSREVAAGLTYADTLPRVVAWIFDLFLLAIVSGIIGAAMGWSTTAISGVDPSTGAVDFSRIATRPEQTILSTVLSALYFILSWTGGRRATLGQRILQIQVGNAVDGRPLRMDQAIKRWLGLGSFLDILSLIPGGVALSGLSLLWAIVLLITTATSPTKQGLHDRFAESVVARPANAGNGLVIACLVILVAIVVISLLGVVALIGLGSQVSSILSTVGDSV